MHPSPTPVVLQASSGQITRLLSLDVFRGLVIWLMLVVNNLGDAKVVPHWFKHPNFLPNSFASDWMSWWNGLSQTQGWYALIEHFGRMPLLTHCTLADFIMPWFLFIMGVAIPFSQAASARRGHSTFFEWRHIVQRSMMLVVLGWVVWDISLPILYYHHSSDAQAKLRFVLGMNVLQLLGVAYLVARVICLLPMRGRLAVAALLLVGHWALIRFYPIPGVEPGTLTGKHNALTTIYNSWTIGGYKVWGAWPPVEWVGDGYVRFSLRGMLSVPPTAATIVLGTWLGTLLMNASISKTVRLRKMVIFGAMLTVAGLVWAFDQGFNKPVWTSSYLLYTAGVATLVIALLHGWVDDGRKVGGWNRPLVVFGYNAIGVYFASLMIKIWVFNMPKVTIDDGKSMFFTHWLVAQFQAYWGAATGSWAFTIGFVLLLWGLAELAYRKRWQWKL